MGPFNTQPSRLPVCVAPICTGKSNDQNGDSAGPGQGRTEEAHPVLLSLETIHLSNLSWSHLLNIYIALVFMGVGVEGAVKGKIEQSLGSWPREDDALPNQRVYRTSWPMHSDPLCALLYPALCPRSCPARRRPGFYLVLWIEPIGSPCRRLGERGRVRSECLFPQPLLRHHWGLGGPQPASVNLSTLFPPPLTPLQLLMSPLLPILLRGLQPPPTLLSPL